jgi:hypothetical protein
MQVGRGRVWARGQDSLADLFVAACSLHVAVRTLVRSLTVDEMEFTDPEKKEASVGDYHGLPSGGLWRTLVEATGRLGVMERETNPCL